ncbi:fatty acid/sphingolipid desaturase, partial [Aureobasidium melanogenum]
MTSLTDDNHNDNIDLDLREDDAAKTDEEAGTINADQSLVCRQNIPKTPPFLFSIYTKSQKLWIILLVSFAATFSGFASNIYFPSIPTIAADLSSSIELINLTVTGYLIFQGLSPTLWGAISDTYGRRVTYICTFIVFIAACVGLAETKSYAQLLVLRCLQSTGSASTIAIGAGVVGDITTREERGGYMGYFQAGLLLPVALGPLIGGALADSLGWRSVFWFLTIYATAFLLVLVALLPETLRSLVGNGSVAPPKYAVSLFSAWSVKHNVESEYSGVTPAKRINVLGSITILLERRPLYTISFVGLFYMVWQMVVTVLSSVFQATYNMSDLQVGLVYLANGVGCMILSAAAIERSIDEGHIIVIHEGYALKLDGWLNKHPGGRLAILHMVGRDATDEINVYHSTHALQRMRAYRIGRITQPWGNLEPPLRRAAIRQRHDISYDEKTQGHRIFDETEARSIQDKTNALKAEHLSRIAFTSAMEQKEIAEGLASMPSVDEHTQLAIAMDFRALHERVKNEGFYDCPYIEYGKELIRYSLLFSTFIYFLRAEWYLTSACFLGIFWQQIMFTAHDAGHRGITGNFVADTLIGAFIADFCCGLSIGWWKSSHNVHHLITNMPEHDPDLQNVPLFATSPTYFRSILSTFYNFTFVWDAVADSLVPYQKYTYYPIMAIARFNLYLLSWLHLMSPRAANLGSAWWTRPVEIFFMAGYWTVFGYGLLWCTLPTWPI